MEEHLFSMEDYLRENEMNERNGTSHYCRTLYVNPPGKQRDTFLRRS